MTHDLFTKSLQQVALVGTAVCGGRSLPLSSHLWRSPAREALRSLRRVRSLQEHLSAPLPGRPLGAQAGRGGAGTPAAPAGGTGLGDQAGLREWPSREFQLPYLCSDFRRLFCLLINAQSLSLSLPPAPLNFQVKKIDMYISENSKGPRRAGRGPPSPKGRAGGARAVPGAEARGPAGAGGGGGWGGGRRVLRTSSRSPTRAAGGRRRRRRSTCASSAAA